MSRPARVLGAAAGLLALVAGPVAGPAAAAPVPVVAAPVVAALDDALVTTWDGPTVNLAADGSTYTTSSSSFSGTPVAVPGDTQGRTVTVTNDGPADAVLRGWVRGVTLLDPDALDVHHATGMPTGDFYTDLTLAWRTASGEGLSSFRELAAAGRTQVVELLLPRGASTQVTVVTSLPLTATSGNRANVAPRAATYEVELRLDGRTPTATASPTPGTGGSGAGSGGADAADAAAAGRGAGGGALAAAALAITGLDVLRAALLAVVGIGVGSLLLGAARRRRDVQHPGGSGSTPSAG
ncbi:hypothetical protein [Cellulomonas phragmiteti]|uniref:Peptidase n=1 Tax=Cellulomonas phragmiteti TaxID=478780 RepID=A0ABQ4DI27_9CELL|nr:hypothetical protein [Cellulomonas phragmiteti]GIG38996.1 hypothetical protein Cph01nite_07580 [Cellulomonas phragmiteti]